MCGNNGLQQSHFTAGSGRAARPGAVMGQPHRRQILQGVAGAATLAALPPAEAVQARRNLIRDENARDGTTDWQLTYTRVDPKTRYRSTRIEGYVSRASVRAG